jgi:hypothetical protein
VYCKDRRPTISVTGNSVDKKIRLPRVLSNHAEAYDWMVLVVLQSNG